MLKPGETAPVRQILVPDQIRGREIRTDQVQVNYGSPFLIGENGRG
jgi:hypothetical protein